MRVRPASSKVSHVPHSALENVPSLLPRKGDVRALAESCVHHADFAQFLGARPPRLRYRGYLRVHTCSARSRVERSLQREPRGSTSERRLHAFSALSHGDIYLSLARVQPRGAQEVQTPSRLARLLSRVDITLSYTKKSVGLWTKRSTLAAKSVTVAMTRNRFGCGSIATPRIR